MKHNYVIDQCHCKLLRDSDQSLCQSKMQTQYKGYQLCIKVLIGSGIKIRAPLEIKSICNFLPKDIKGLNTW